MDLIYNLVYNLIAFVFDNIGFIVGVLVIVGGMISARNKAKKVRRTENVPREHRDFFEDYEESPTPKPFAKTFKNIMAEIEAELNEAPDVKPWDLSSEGRGYSPEGRSRRTSSGFPEGSSAYPRKAPVQPKVKNTAVPPKPTVEPVSVSMPGDLTAMNSVKVSSGKPKKRNELVTAVIMSEVLGKPKGLQDEM